tara:strand:+ start:459 stop:566 length:108 start_codon:yes stop_codon:yes gene_type:complete
MTPGGAVGERKENDSFLYMMLKTVIQAKTKWQTTP